MKKLLAVIILAAMITGCTGLNVNTVTNVATDTAFVFVLQNNPTYKPAVVAALTTIKTYMAGNVTYTELVAEISKQFPAQYSVVGVILLGYIAADRPVIESIPMLDSYKAAVVKKIDHFLVLASM
jgi:hypothetical protein